jgi:hypothetical protein
MNIIKTTIFCLAMSIMAFPSLSNVQAYTNNNLENIFTFPTPASKPMNDIMGESDDRYTHYDEKQAMVAALGLYLGVKQATPPTSY